MSTGADSEDWALLNQKLLNAELLRLRHRLEGTLESDADHAQALDAAVDEARAAMPAPAALEVVTHSFALSPFEREVLLLCCGVELDARVGDACARVNGNPAHRNATFSMALALLSDAHWSAVTPDRPLRRWKLVEVEQAFRLVDSPLRVDERILHFVAGIDQVDARLRALLSPLPAPARVMTSSHARLVVDVARCLGEGKNPLVVLEGDPQSRLDVALAAIALSGCRPMSLSMDDLPVSAADLEPILRLCEREARLSPVVMLLDASANARALARFVAVLGAPCIVMSHDPVDTQRVTARFTAEKPDATEQNQLWTQALGESASMLNGGVDALAAQFRLNARAIDTAAVASRAATSAPELLGALRGAARTHGRARLESLAQRIETKAGWKDLVLPVAQTATLREVAAQVRQRARVLDDWGFAGQGTRGLGTSALFSGESGTGKTLAAEVLARELDMDLYRVDLSSVVSKYIGETEKNLRRVFDAADDSGAILLFDEADALFGKRSEVKDSHDRYANIEISYLLQRMEAYAGLAILTTNMKSALDRAFTRRLRFIVNFPFPDTAMREEIWRRVFPTATPRDGVDYAKLARLNLPGGNIRNIALGAAFLAADTDGPVTMTHLLRAAQSESAKLDRALAEAEVRGWT
jgi:hypothetical protein